MADLSRRSPPELEDGAPLLDSAGGASSFCCCRKRLAHRCQAAQTGLREWWRVTTCESFLASSGSRRDLWGSVSFFALCISLVGDFALGAGWPNCSLDGLACVVAPFLSFLPRETLRADAVIITSFVLLNLSYAVFGSIGAPVSACFYGLVLAIDGVHSSAVVAYFVGSVAVLSCMGVEGVEMLLFGGPLFTALAMVLEYRAAVCVDALRKNYAATKDLLDKAGDGFCSVDAATGLISSASPKLERTLGATRGLVGRRFSDYVMEADAHCVQALCAAAQAGGLLKEDLVTCCVCGSNQSEEPEVLLVFEAKLLPHMVGDGEFCICVQVQGEMRLQPRHCEPPVRVTAAPPAPDPDDQLSMSSLAYSLSQHTGHEAPRRATPQAQRKQAQHCVDAATQTLSRPPLPAKMEGRPRSSAAGSSRSHQQHESTQMAARSQRPRVSSNTSQRLLPQFDPTPADTVRRIVIDTMKGINANGRGCCAWHILWKVVMREVYAQPCQPQFTPHTGFQCSRCLAMNERDNEGDGDSDQEAETCSFCGGPAAAQAGSGAVSSSGEVADVEVPSKTNSAALSSRGALDGAAPSTDALAALRTLTEESLDGAASSTETTSVTSTF